MGAINKRVQQGFTLIDIGDRNIIPFGSTIRIDLPPYGDLGDPPTSVRMYVPWRKLNFSLGTTVHQPTRIIPAVSETSVA